MPDGRKMSDDAFVDSLFDAIRGRIDAAKFGADYCGVPLTHWEDKLRRRLRIMRELCEALKLWQRDSTDSLYDALTLEEGNPPLQTALKDYLALEAELERP